jgi:hypothetical protein
VARSTAPEPRARSFAIGGERQCRPISAHEELGDDGLDSAPPTPSPLMQKRRSLAMAEDNRPSAYLQAVPLPGQSADDKPEPDPATADPEPVAEADIEPLELAGFTMPEEELGEEPVEVELDDGLEALRRSIHTPDEADAQTCEPTGFRAAPEPDPAPVDPLPFAAPSLRRSLAPAFDEEEQAEMPDEFDAEQVLDDQAFAEEPAPQLSIVDHGGEAAADDRPTEELGLVQLAARLGASIEKRRARLAERQLASPASPPPPTPFGDAEDFEAAQAEDAARAIADFFGPAQAAETPAIDQAERTGWPEEAAADAGFGSQESIPAPLRGVSFDEEDDEDHEALAASFSLPLGGSLPADPLAQPDGDDFDEEGDDGEYSSLLEMKNPFARQQEFVRVDEPDDDGGSFEPTVTFPSAGLLSRAGSGGEVPDAAARPFDPPKTPVESALRPAAVAAPRDPGDAERSLRDALATLQRMSGAA